MSSFTRHWKILYARATEYATDTLGWGESDVRAFAVDYADVYEGSPRPISPARFLGEWT